ncbi:MAG: radical SAM protein [Pseudomonadota bacterium]
MTERPIRKIVFIEPKSPGSHIYSKWGLPRLGILMLGAILKKAGYEVKVFLEEIKGIDFDDVFDADLVGISSITSTAPRAYEMANLIRKAGIPVFMGGPHVSFLAEEALEHCDFVMCGEAEDVIIAFVKALESGKGFDDICGLAYKIENKIHKNKIAPHNCDLDRYPFPDFSLISGSKKFKGDLSITPIMTSRGCPFGCNFCSVTAMFGRRYRFRSVENVMAELRQKKPEWVFFYDDNFAANPKHTKELLQQMIDEHITPKWSAQVRIDVAKDLELLRLMKRAGCTYVYIGLESINRKTLEELNKGQTPEDIEKAIKIIHSFGINIHGMFIFGADNDDPKTIRATVKFAKKNEIASVQFMILTPLPGTHVFKMMAEEGRLLSRDWGYYDAHHVVFEPKGMSVLQLQKLTFKAMMKFYSFPQILSRLNRFDIWTMIIRAHGWRMTRKSRANMRGFVKQLKELYRQAGCGINSARHGIQLQARRTSDDIKEMMGRINIERIRKIKEERVKQWRATKILDRDVSSR